MHETLRIDIMTLFPDMIRAGMNDSVIGRAVRNGLITVDAVNIRDYSTDKHRHVDDYPYGGGAGMVMQPGNSGQLWHHIPGERQRGYAHTF